jgi:amidase
MTAVEQAQAVRDGAISARELAERSLATIERLDPQLNAFREVIAETALAEADARDRQRADGDDLPLLGVPVAIKDETDVEGVVTRYGGNSMSTPAPRDAEVVRRLRAAGAVIVGKTNLPEFGQWPFTESAAVGYTRNPWNPQYQTGGSSGGTAAAVASGMVPVALGSDGGGSIRIPSACCGLFGLKTQRGRNSSDPWPDGWRGLGVTGPLARTVLDAAVFADASRGNVATDRYQWGEPRISFTDAARSEPGRLRIMLSEKSAVPTVKLDRQQRAALHATADALVALGHDVVPGEPDFGQPMLAFVPQNGVSLLEQSRAVDHPERLERRTKQNIVNGKLTPPAVVERAMRYGDEISDRVERSFEQFDLILQPTIAALPRQVGVLDGATSMEASFKSFPYIAYTYLWNVTGHPAGAVPAGFAENGLPLSAQLIAARGDEPTILQVAAQLERERPWADRWPPVS